MIPSRAGVPETYSRELDRIRRLELAPVGGAALTTAGWTELDGRYGGYGGGYPFAARYHLAYRVHYGQVFLRGAMPQPDSAAPTAGWWRLATLPTVASPQEDQVLVAVAWTGGWVSSDTGLQPQQIASVVRPDGSLVIPASEFVRPPGTWPDLAPVSAWARGGPGGYDLVTSSFPLG